MFEICEKEIKLKVIKVDLFDVTSLMTSSAGSRQLVALVSANADPTRSTNVPRKPGDTLVEI